MSAELLGSVSRRPAANDSTPEVGRPNVTGARHESPLDHQRGCSAFDVMRGLVASDFG